MAEPTFPAELIALQKRSDQAWATIESHRREVDARRRAEAESAGAKVDPSRPWASPTLPAWTEEEDARHEALVAEAREAAQALRQALTDSGLGTAAEVVQGLRTAARTPPDADS